MDTAVLSAQASPSGWVKFSSGASCSDTVRKSLYFTMTCSSSASFFPSLEDDPFSSPLPIGDSAFTPTFNQPLQIANELWWDVLSRLSLPDRMQARLVCQLFNSIIASQLRHVTLSHASSSVTNAPQDQPSAEYSEEKLLRFMDFLRRGCPNLKGMTVSPDIKSSHSFMGTICGMHLTALSFYGCTNFSDRHLESLADSSLSCSVEFLILCGTRITDKGITHLQSFEKLSRLFVCSTRASKKMLNLLQPTARESALAHEDQSTFKLTCIEGTEISTRDSRSHLLPPSQSASMQRNLRQLQETIGWLQAKQTTLHRRIHEKGVIAQQAIRKQDRDTAMSALRRRKMYAHQLARLVRSTDTIYGTLRSFAARHDLSRLLDVEGPAVSQRSIASGHVRECQDHNDCCEEAKQLEEELEQLLIHANSYTIEEFTREHPSSDFIIPPTDRPHAINESR